MKNTITLKKKLFRLIFFAGIILCGEIPGQLNAVGFRLPNQDPEAIARGDAFAATADDPAAIYYNPAGITQLPGGQFSVGVYAISPDISYKSTTGASANSHTDFQYVPQVYFTYSFTNVPISIGFGIYAPYGLSLNYGDSNPFNTVAQSGKLLYATFNPVIAWHPLPSLSIGAGPTINYSQAKFQRAIGLIPGDQFAFKGDALGYGFNAGILWQPHPMFSFGVNYHSPTTLTYDGTISTYPSPPFPPSASTRAAIHFPQYIVGGISFRPTPNWNFEFDLDWTEWSVVKQIAFQDPALGNPALVLNFRNSFIYDFGITRQLGEHYWASVGYIYAENSSPSANFNPLIPDANLQLGSVGFGYRGEHWNFALAYHFGYNGGRTISNDANVSADGTYKTFNNAINASMTYKF
jgi:long-chain fatty acid transport protein